MTGAPASAFPVREPAVRPRIGLAGAGWIGRLRLAALAGSGAARVTAVADPDPAALDAALQLAPGSATVADFDALLGLDLDGIVIATPSALHAGQAISALERGLAVFCQKPLAVTAAEARRVAAAARAAGRLLQVDLCYRQARASRAVRDLVRSRSLGRVYAADLVFHNAYGPDQEWFYDPARAGGGCLIDLGTHLVDLALWTLGDPAVASASGRLFAGGRPWTGEAVEDYAVARLDLADGAVVTLACSWNLPAGQDAVIEGVFYGTRGGARWRNVRGSFFDLTAERLDGTSRRTLVEPPDDWGGRAITAWVEALAAGAGYDPGVETVVAVAKVLDRLYGRDACGSS